MTLKRIRLELARDPDYPNGSHERGYDAIAPLDGEGRLLAAEWREHRDRCRVRRFWPGRRRRTDCHAREWPVGR